MNHVMADVCMITDPVKILSSILGKLAFSVQNPKSNALKLLICVEVCLGVKMMSKSATNSYNVQVLLVLMVHKVLTMRKAASRAWAVVQE